VLLDDCTFGGHFPSKDECVSIPLSQSTTVMGNFLQCTLDCKMRRILTVLQIFCIFSIDKARNSDRNVSVMHAYAMSHASANGDRGKWRAPHAWLAARLSQQRQQTLVIIGSLLALQHIGLQETE